jgi:hypothetical protein
MLHKLTKEQGGGRHLNIAKRPRMQDLKLESFATELKCNATGWETMVLLLLMCFTAFYMRFRSEFQPF